MALITSMDYDVEDHIKHLTVLKPKAKRLTIITPPLQNRKRIY